MKDKYSAQEFKEMIKNGKLSSNKKGRWSINEDVEMPKAEKESKPKKQKPKCPVTGKEYDSKGEIYISWWIKELIDAGYIESVEEQPESFILTEPVRRTIEKQLKTKVKEVEEFVLHGHHYTPDFKITWTQKAFDDNMVIEFFGKIKKEKHHLFAFDGVTYLEAKPDSLKAKKSPDMLNMERLFSNKVKEVFDKHNILVELVYHNKLFKTTFIPKRYLIQDKTHSNRAIKYEYKLLKYYVESIRK